MPKRLRSTDLGVIHALAVNYPTPGEDSPELFQLWDYIQSDIITALANDDLDYAHTLRRELAHTMMSVERTPPAPTSPAWRWVRARFGRHG